MPDYNGWERIDPAIGEGGQSSVYLVRRPERAIKRRQALSSLQPFSNSANHQSYAEAIYTLTRPELPNEIGALKIFHFRKSSGPPVERLKRETAILAKGWPNLPRLLDFNLNELWMVTEYFAKGTLAHYPGKFKGKPLEALTAFRGLVDTIAMLHKEGVVHRDIKSENVFVADDGRLILGDFGLVYRADDSPRVTMLHETVGPWQHLPWWANTGDRLENPTPAVDVFLLGSLLWCMVSGESRLHGDKFRNDIYNLEKKFSHDGRMGLVNLVLSQCLADEEKKIVKDAGEVLEIVDEVIAAIADRAPIFDENDVLVIPCRICKKGFLQQIAGPDAIPLQTDFTFHRRGANRRDIYVEVFQCDICMNFQFFGVGEPYKGLYAIKSKSRMNPQPSKGSNLRW